MVRISKSLGFMLGLVMGIYTRDNYVYPYPLKVQQLEEDYQKISKDINLRIEAGKSDLEKI